ncbi:arylsulfatase [Xylariaceae sp. FL0255]|nr:arylsulfatase [Xylariaceae sp. FL0255]
MASIIIPITIALINLAFASGSSGTGTGSRANIVFIMSDDQDRRLNSLDYMTSVQRDLKAKGVEFTNHYTNQALCCPSRSTILRGQTTHNTNITNVIRPGGSYNKWVESGQDKNYMPHWMNAAGYTTEYIGKIMNGYGLSNYNVTVKGWDHTDLLVEPYIDDFNSPVFSANGETPIYYKGFHSTDVVRIKALDRLDALTDQSQPFLMIIAPFSPHVAFQNNKPSQRTIPLQRHLNDFPGVKAPRTPNFNPSDEYQQGAGGWVRTLLPMNESAIDWADFVYRSRIQSVVGVDEIVEDVVAMLERKNVMNNTFVIFTSDNGYHVGQHRMPGGKGLFYNEDTNLPFVVRGPGVPQNVTSNIPSLHIDLAPTFLDIAGVQPSDLPVFLDGQSVLPQWLDPNSTSAAGVEAGEGNSKESINIEYWGVSGIEAPSGGQLGSPFKNNTYKTIRMLGESQSWVYTVWCSGEKELYDLSADPWELTNIINESNSTQMVNRLNALLMVTKSCEQDSCRDPWALIQPTTNASKDGTVSLQSLTQAMNPSYDEFFANFKKVSFRECLQVQDVENEAPYFPELTTLTSQGLGRAYRNATDFIAAAAGGKRLITTSEYYGTAEQRNATISDLNAASRPLTDAEIHSEDGSEHEVTPGWMGEIEVLDLM